MIQLDARLRAIADCAVQVMKDEKAPVFADIGCDHGFLTAHMLMRLPQLKAIASDVSAPSLEKARRLLASLGLEDRAKIAVADGLGAIDRPVNVVVAAGMGTQTILKIAKEGMDRLGDAVLIVQSNVDIPALREGLSALGLAVGQEYYTQAAGRHYVTLTARKGEMRLDERTLLLGSAAGGVREPGQREYFLWQRGVRMREMSQLALCAGESAKARLNKNAAELTMISEALSMQECTVHDVEAMVGGIAPFEKAEEWDNVGLLVGRRGAKASRVLVALDLTGAVIDEAAALGAQAIVTHHPMMFSARKRITDEDREGELLLRLAENGIAHIAAHTNLDAACGGVNDVLMQKMGAKNVSGEGCIRIGELEDGLTLDALAARAQHTLKASVRVYGAGDTPVKRLGCCSGAGSSEIALAASMGADCFITGEVKHNYALDAMDMGLCIIEAGHYETENPVCEVLAEALQNTADELKYNVTVFCSKVHPFGR